MSILRRLSFISLIAVILSLTACSLNSKLKPGSNTLKIAFGSCVKNPDTPLWDVIRRENPDLLFFLGDNIYQDSADFGDRARIGRLYERLFENSGHQSLFRSIPAFAIWDDHDFGPDNGDSSYQGREASLKEFRRVWTNNPKPPPGLEDTVAFELRAGPALILATDNRTFRQNPARFLEARMFGETQLLWLEEKLKKPEAAFVILAAGSQWLSRTFADQPEKYENLSEYPDDSQRIFKAIETSPATVILISGDRHFAEILSEKFGSKRVFDLTSSPISAELADGLHDATESRRVALVHGWNNFGLLSINASTMKAEVEIIGVGGRRLISLPLEFQSE